MFDSSVKATKEKLLMDMTTAGVLEANSLEASKHVAFNTFACR